MRNTELALLFQWTWQESKTKENLQSKKKRLNAHHQSIKRERMAATQLVDGTTD